MYSAAGLPVFAVATAEEFPRIGAKMKYGVYPGDDAPTSAPALESWTSHGGRFFP
jgi:hypothetical protein